MLKRSNNRRIIRYAEDFLIDAAQLMAGGYTLSDSVIILSQESRYGPVPTLLKESLAEGFSFSEALKEIHTNMDPVISMYIRSAEQAGNLPHVMREVSSRILASRKWNQMVSEILFYPRLVLITVTLILDAFWFFFLPFMESFLYSMGIEPLFWTRLVVLSKLFWWVLPLINMGSAWVAFSDALVSKLVPKSVKGLGNDSWLFSSLESMLQSGLPMGTAILTLSKVDTTFKVEQETLMRLYERLRSGQRLSMAMSMEKGRWDSSIISRIAIAEKNGVLSQALSSITAQLEQKRQKVIASYVQVLKSVSVLIAGLAVFGITYSVYKPMIQMLLELSGI